MTASRLRRSGSNITIGVLSRAVRHPLPIATAAPRSCNSFLCIQHASSASARPYVRGAFDGFAQYDQRGEHDGHPDVRAKRNRPMSGMIWKFDRAEDDCWDPHRITRQHEPARER
jgi:hypothetical protein